MRLPLTAVAVLLAYVAAVTAFGTWLGRRRRSVEDYFLAGRSVPWWAVAACVVATETSTLTFIGAPGIAYNADWTFLQLVFGYILGRIAIAVLFLPAYFQGRIYTSYELLQRRFGGAVRAASAGIFLLYRHWPTASACTPRPWSSPLPRDGRTSNGSPSPSWAWR
jgi:Na+/proline symporter